MKQHVPTRARRARLLTLVLAMVLAACGGRSGSDPEKTGQGSSPLTNPTPGVLPPAAVGSLAWITASGDAALCSTTLVAPQWTLTSLHCFVGIAPSGAHGRVHYAGDTVEFEADDVFLPPNFNTGLPTGCRQGPPGRTLADLGHTLTSAEVVSPLDIVLVRLNRPTAVRPAKIWHPVPDATADPIFRATNLAGVQVTLTGWDPVDIQNAPKDATAPGTALPKRVGTNHIEGLLFGSPSAQVTSDFHPDPRHPAIQLVRSASSSQGEGGDSGSGLFLAGTPPSSSAPFSGKCAVTPWSPGLDLPLVGVFIGSINEIALNTPIQSFYVPVYGPELSEWIGAVTADDTDGDGICDSDDKCKTVCDDQKNCNQEAEIAWGRSSPLGDACDPAPCPTPTLEGAGFTPGPGIPTSIVPLPIPALPAGFPIERFPLPSQLQQRGRRITDKVHVDGILASQFGPVSSNVTPRFCLCGDAQGQPITVQRQCQVNNSCALSPVQADGAFAEVPAPVPLPDRQTAWHIMKVGSGAPGTAFPITYPTSTPLRELWDFAADNQRWQTAGFFVPPAPDPNFGAGTDLAGELWAHDPTRAGATAHGLDLSGDCDPTTTTCTIADDYDFNVAPDRRATGVGRTFSIPIVIQACNFCRVCGLPGGGTGPFPPLGGRRCVKKELHRISTITPALNDLVLWGPAGGILANELFSPALRTSLGRVTDAWVTHSEPASLCNSEGCTDAYLLAPDATKVLDALVVTPTGFAMAVADDVGIGEVPGKVLDVLGPTPRTGFAAVWSRMAAALYVVGGRDPETGAVRQDLWRFHEGDTAWSSVPVGPGHVEQALAAVYSHRDQRLWVLDGREGDAHLLRVNPELGLVETDVRVPSLGGFTRMWLRTIEDGRVVLVATNATSHVVALLTTDPFTSLPNVRVEGAKFDTGEVLSPPFVNLGEISVGIGPTDSGFGIDTVVPEVRKPADLVDPWPELTSDLNLAPVAICRDVTLGADSTCNAQVSPSDIDGGSFDPNHDAFGCVVSDPGPLALGAHTVSLICTDSRGATDSCLASVTVADQTPPVFTSVPGPTTITTCVNAPIGVATATDNCGAVTVTSDAPQKFSLGTTVVTWTARDAAGNVQTATQSVTALLGDSTSCCPSGTNIIVGTSASDVIVGTDGADCILARDGDDVIDARGGNDFVSGGSGRDTIFAGEGDDVVFGGDGDDTINAAPGTNFIDGGEGTDTCFGDPASDTLVSCP